ncbi:MAG: FG-GAP-like repeat-containing protein [Candidatus Eisenbacteria bacterium]
MRKPSLFRFALPAALTMMVLLVPATGAEDRPATNVEELTRLAERFRDELEAGRTPLYYDLLSRTTGPQGALNGIEDVQLMYLRDGRIPVYYETQNINAARTLSTDDVWPGGSGGFSLTGSTTNLGDLCVWDAGAVRTSHQEFGGRASQEDGASTTHYHSTHVAGTLIAAGVQANAKGMSYQADLACYDWNSDNGEMADAAAAGMEVSNHSYGYATGWSWSGSDWYWYGDVDVSTVEDYGFGFYDEVTREWDEIAHNAPYYTIVASAGNDRDDDGPGPGGGHYYWNPGSGSWEWSTATRNPDGGTNGYDCISWNKTAKNILSIGAVDDIPGGWSQPADVDVAYFSGWGPTDDGRIKPDFVANGLGLYSTDDDNNSDYTTLSGTSMASPNAAGSINLLVRHYEITHGLTPLSSTMKAVLVQTADEAGPNPGPDYMHGWGLINTLHGAEMISSDVDEPGTIHETTLANGAYREYYMSAAAGDSIRVSIAWTDPPGTPPAAAVDPTDIMLVNDLDLRVESPTVTTYSPWVLNPASPASAATKGDNFRDNCEQVVVAAPSAGVYRAVVSHKGILSSSQAYSIVSDHPLYFGTPPDPPVAVTASDTSCVEVVVGWTAVPLADDYRVYRNGAAIAVVAAPAVLYRDTVAAGTYEYGVAAGNEFGYSDSTVASGSVLPAPGAPAWLTASDTSAVFVRLDWAGVPDADNYLLYRDGGPVATVPAPGTTYDDTVAAGVYLYEVLAENGCGQSPAAYDSGTVLPPPIPPAWYDASSWLPPAVENTRASAWADFDDDGDQDLYVVRGPGENALLVNYAGVFADETPAELRDEGDGYGAVWADFNNDARIDLFLANDGTNRLFQNDGGGGFTDVAVEPLGDPTKTVCGAWADFDNDRKVDLFFINDMTPSRLLRNVGVGPFVDVTLFPLDYTDEPGAVAWGDYDNDGDADLYRLGRSPGESRLLRNEGFGFFSDVTPAPLMNPAFGVGALWGDFDNDLDLDLFVWNEGAGTGLFWNSGGASFTAAAWSPALAGVARSAASGDVDFDGDLDIFIGTEMGVQLFRNDGGGAFVDGTEPFLFDATDDVRSVTLSDIDQDGDLDLFAGVFGPDRLFRNDVNAGNRWVHLILVGTASNRSAIGARARVVAGAAVQIREVSGGVGGGQSSLPLEFGLGAATQVDTVEIRWPSGFTQIVTGLAAPGFHVIVEDELSTGVAVDEERAPDAFRMHPNTPNPFNPLTTIGFELPTQSRVRVAVYDVSGRRIALLADGVRPAGRFDVVWDGRDEAGRTVPSGVYFARMEAPDFSATHKMLLVR